ncbi:hypothetical protein GCM10007898_14580 [Dyella flagellata]|uniref:Uncharacterized protein n=1 Tax=Dyella flagellata TaxID=1867833 RepID=A0ABQ5X8I3_9GAMM|nr:hypothetical protein GCM10007898_14580 [Dyella flagellata]
MATQPQQPAFVGNPVSVVDYVNIVAQRGHATWKTQMLRHQANTDPRGGLQVDARVIATVARSLIALAGLRRRRGTEREYGANGKTAKKMAPTTVIMTTHSIPHFIPKCAAPPGAYAY